MPERERLERHAASQLNMYGLLLCCVLGHKAKQAGKEIEMPVPDC